MKSRFGFVVLAFVVTGAACRPERLVNSLLADNAEARNKALARLAKMTDQRQDPLVPKLVERLENADSRVVQRASVALAVIGENAVPALAEVLGSGSLAARLTTLELLGDLGPASSKAASAISEQAKDPHPLIQEQAQLALSKINKNI